MKYLFVLALILVVVACNDAGRGGRGKDAMILPPIDTAKVKKD
jgi:hypothetical protein